MNRIRCFHLSDASVLAELYFASVRFGATAAYTTAQTEAWAPEVPEIIHWTKRLCSQTVFVAEDSSGIAGFMSYSDDGHIDLAFVRPDRIGTGIGSELYLVVERSAIDRNISVLTTQASDMARVLFERHGWTLVITQQVKRHGVAITNHVMKKTLDRHSEISP